LLYTALIYGCGGSGGSGESNESAYYDQLWAIAKESITPDMADAEISEALARWIVDNSTNARWVPPNSTYPLPDGARGSEDDILPFHGLCDDRSVLFVNLATRAGLTASVFFIFDFGGPGNDHTCVQVFYEDDWHFFDVTYAGMFKVDGDVLSFEEMRADPALAIAGMVVFEQTGDIRDYYSSGLPVDNEIRMHDVYTEEALVNATITERM